MHNLKMKVAEMEISKDNLQTRYNKKRTRKNGSFFCKVKSDYADYSSLFAFFSL